MGFHMVPYYQPHIEQIWSKYLQKSAVRPENISGAHASLGHWYLIDNQEVYNDWKSEQTQKEF